MTTVPFVGDAMTAEAFRYAPLHYPQGSHYLIKRLLKLIPPHDVYVEVFGGAANLLFAKESSRVEVYNDINGDLVNFFRVLRDDEKWKILQEKLLLTPYAREEFNLALQPAEMLDEIESARRFYVRIQMSFSGWGKSFSYSRGKTSKPPRKYFSKVANFEFFHERIKNVIIENLDFEDVIRRYDTPNTFFFCDPPYIGNLAKSPRLFLDMSLSDHERLVNTLLQVQGKVLLLGYSHPIYEKLREYGWHFQTLELAVFVTNARRTRGKRQYRERCLWTNYQPPPSPSQITLTDFSEKPTTL